MSPKILALLNWTGLILVLVFNGLANGLPINGLNTGQVSAFYPNRFVPAGFTFSIWSVIYSLMIGYVVVSTKWVLHRPQSVQYAVTVAIGPLFFLTCILNAGWILAWHYLQTGLSVLLMLAFLFTLILLYRRLQPFRKELYGLHRIFLYGFFVVYLAWISVATIANITALLVKYEWQGFGLDPALWSMTLMAVAILLGMLFLWQRKDHAYAWVVAWALFGIYHAQGTASPEIGQLALAGIAMLLLLSAFYYLLPRPRL